MPLFRHHSLTLWVSGKIGKPIVMIPKLLFILLGFPLLAGCTTYDQHVANGLVGQNIQTVYNQIGQPASIIQDNSDPANPLTIQYFPNFRWFKAPTFIQTGSVYTGQTIIGMTAAGNGVGSEPVYQNHYAATGYYQQHLYRCAATLKVNQAGTIVGAATNGPGCHNHVWWMQAKNW